MVGFPSPFGGDAEGEFDDEDAFVPEHLPDPGPFLAGQDVLAGEDHVAFHATTREVFEERGVYDVTFGYNLAQLNRDVRHPDAGFRYAVERDAGDAPDAGEDAAVLRAAFAPTTEFCPQTETLTVAAFRAWNGERERHDYDLVRVRTAPMHHQSAAVNGKLAALEERFLETGSVPEGSGVDVDGAVPGAADGPPRSGDASPL